MSLEQIRRINEKRADLAVAFGEAFLNRQELPCPTGFNKHPFAATAQSASLADWARYNDAGILTPAFADTLSLGYGHAFTQLPPVYDITVLARNHRVENYHSVQVSSIDITSPDALPEDGAPLMPQVSEMAQTGNLLEYCIYLKISREMLVGDDRNIIDSLVAQTYNHLTQKDFILLAALLNNNVVLGDGQAMIIAGNTSSGQDVNGLADAADKLATTVSAQGNYQAIMPRILLCAPNVAVKMAVVLESIRATLPIKLVVNPWLTASTVYLLGDPQETPVFTRLLFGNGRPTINPATHYWSAEKGRNIDYSGAGLLLLMRYETNVVPVSRHIVKIASA